jgi:hypothetical protein
LGEYAPPGSTAYIFWPQVAADVLHLAAEIYGTHLLSASMKWRLDNISPEYRWYPVLKKYIAYLSARVDGSGGDAACIVASQTGIPAKIKRQAEYEEYTGKVCEVIYDCFADFAGFVLTSCCARHSFRSRERAIGEIALLSCTRTLD